MRRNVRSLENTGSKQVLLIGMFGTMRAIRIPLALLLVLTFSFASASPASAAVDDPVYAALWRTSWEVYRFWQVGTAPLPWTGRRRVERTLTIDIATPRDHVFDVYSDVNNHIGRHPFLQRVITHEDYVRDGIHVVNFTAIENVPIAGVPVPTPTYAHQEHFEDAYVYTTDTWTAPNVVTHQRTTFQDLGNGRTRITESMMFEADILLIDFTVTNGVSAHQATMQSFKAAFESGAI